MPFKVRFIAVNPVVFVDAPESDAHQPLVIGDTETAALLVAMHRTDSDVYIATLSAASTGLRKGELLVLTRGGTDLAKGEIDVEQTLHALVEGELLLQPPRTEQSKRAIALPGSPRRRYACATRPNPR